MIKNTRPLGMIAAICIGEGSLFMMPFLVGSMTQLYEISAGHAGLVLSLQMVVMTLTSLLIAAGLRRVTLRTAGVAGGVLALGAHLLAAAGLSWTWLLVSRVLVGMGEGLALATANAAAARTARPHASFALLTFSMSAMGVLFYASIPHLSGLFGYRAALIVLVALCLLLLPLMFFLPSERCRTMASNKGAEAENPTLITGMFVAAIIAFVVFYIGINGLWSYTERIAAAAQISVAAISNAYLLAAILGLAGPYLARISTERWGLRLPLIGGVLVQVTGNLVVGGAHTPFAFACGTVLIMIGYLFLLPFFKTTLALLDPSGRLAASAAGLQAGGTALGPGAAGLLLTLGGTYDQIVYVSAACIVLATTLIALCSRRSGIAPHASCLSA